MANRARDWFEQSLHDLDQAEDSHRAGRHEWACFASQQAAEKAVKSLHLYLGQEAGHVIAKLLVELPQATRVPKDLIERGRVLDNFYSHPEGAPFEHYGRLQSEEAIRHARAVVNVVRSQMA